MEAGASPQVAVLGGATIAGFFAAACRRASCAPLPLAPLSQSWHRTCIVVRVSMLTLS